jgi:hypothetical protein
MQEESEQYHPSHPMSTWDNSSIHVEQFLAPPPSGISSNILSTQTAFDRSHATLQTLQFQNSRPAIANAAPSNWAGYSLRQSPQSLGFGDDPGSDISQSSQILSAVPRQSNVPSDRHTSLTQKQLDSMIEDRVKERLNEAMSSFRQIIMDDLQNRLSLNVSQISSNSLHFPTTQPGNIGPSQGNMQLIENRTWNQGAQHPVHLQEQDAATSMELSDATFGMPTMSPMTASHGISGTYRSLQASNEYNENELGDVSNIFDSSVD